MISRREALRLGASASVAVATAIAGCPSPGQTILDDDPQQGGAPNGPNGDGTTARGGQQTGGVTTTDDRPLTSAPDYGNWFDNVGNYDGRTVVYLQSRTDVTIKVGAQAADGNHAFQYPAIAVPEGVTITWEWTGEGGAHNVVAVNGEFDSGQPVDSGEASFEASFNEQGTFRYYCETHRADGMKGAITVY